MTDSRIYAKLSALCWVAWREENGRTEFDTRLTRDDTLIGILVSSPELVKLVGKDRFKYKKF